MSSTIDLSGGGGGAPQATPTPSPAPPPAAAPAGASSYGGGGNFLAQAAKEMAYQHAQVGWEGAKEGATALGAQAMHHFKNHVQDGPAGVSILCFIGGLATTSMGALGLIGSFLSAFTDPFHYLLNGYLMIFGAVTVLLEADVEFVRNLKLLGHFAPVLERYQLEVEKRAQFLTELRGRGFFYLFIGSLAITQCMFCFDFLAGIWNTIMGVLCLMMSFGINPADHMVVQPANSQHAAPLVGSNQQGSP